MTDDAAIIPAEWSQRVVSILNAGRAHTRAVTSTARLKIMSKEPVVVPDGKGGVRERFLVEVPALENEATGEVFLEDEALEILDREKEEAMARCAAQDLLRGLLLKPEYASRLSGFPTRRHLTFRVAFGAGESPTVDASSYREVAMA